MNFFFLEIFYFFGKSTMTFYLLLNFCLCFMLRNFLHFCT